MESYSCQGLQGLVGAAIESTAGSEAGKHRLWQAVQQLAGAPLSVSDLRAEYEKASSLSKQGELTHCWYDTRWL